MSKHYQKVVLAILITSSISYADEKIKSPKDLMLTDPDMTSNLMQTTLGLLVILAVIFAAAWAVKRFGHFQGRTHGMIKVIGGVSLGARERIVLLQIGAEQLVVGVAPGRIQTLHILEKPLPIDDKKEIAHVSFSDRLHAAIKVSKKQNSIDDGSNR